LPGQGSNAISKGLGINLWSDEVGGSQAGTTAGTPDEFLYRGGVMSDITPTGWSNTIANGINGFGQIVLTVQRTQGSEAEGAK
jgi:uncharacterized membrane protein